MTSTIRRRRLSLAALLAAVALSPAMPAQASAAGPIDCETRLERLEERFRQVEAKHGWDYASEWWEKKWAKYHKRCVLG